MIKKVRKLPQVVESVQFTGEIDNFRFLETWSEGKCRLHSFAHLVVQTLEGTVSTGIGSYIIKGPKGEVWPVREDIFNETYEILEEE